MDTVVQQRLLFTLTMEKSLEKQYLMDLLDFPTCRLLHWIIMTHFWQFQPLAIVDELIGHVVRSKAVAKQVFIPSLT